MTDLEFLSALEQCSLAPSEFTHAAHVRAGYLYLRDHPFAEALARMQRSIRAYAASVGKPEKYHETVTVAFLALIQQQRIECGDPGSWIEFQRQNGQLLAKDCLLQYYSKQQLESELARRTFMLPR